MSFEDNLNERIQEAFSASGAPVVPEISLASLDSRQFNPFKGRVDNPDNPIIGYQS